MTQKSQKQNIDATSQPQDNTRLDSLITQVQRPDEQVSLSGKLDKQELNSKRSSTKSSKSSSIQMFFKSFFCCLPSVDFALVDAEPKKKRKSATVARKSKSEKGHVHAGIELKDVRKEINDDDKNKQDEEKPRKRNSKRNSNSGKRKSSSAKEEKKPLLREPRVEHKTKKTLVLDLDETLVHSSFKPVKNADFIVQVEIEKTIHNVYVCKRPGVDEFLTEVGKLYEVVIFTASLSKYADPVIDYLDPNKVVAARLFREACTFNQGNYMKDLSRLGRDLGSVLIIDNSPYCYALQPNNAMAIASWFDDPADTQLFELLPWLNRIANESSVYSVLEELRNYQGKFL